MDTPIGDASPPKSTDLDGWRQAIADGCLKAFKLEAIAAAFQDLGQRDTRVQSALAKHLSDSILHMLRSRVGFNHPNRGEDIILRVHGEIFAALLRPASADGRNLRQAFGPRVLFRMKDAIAAELRERRIPGETQPKGKSKTKQVKGSEDANEIEVEIIDLAAAAEEPEPTDNEATSPQKHPDSDLFGGVRDADEEIDMNRILECIPDYRKRLAFQLFMNDVPYKSKRKDVTSIAGALGISEKTARDWIKEVRGLLEENDNVKQLRGLGDRT
jgi:hypothetical protein